MSFNNDSFLLAEFLRHNFKENPEFSKKFKNEKIINIEDKNKDFFKHSMGLTNNVTLFNF